MNAVHRTRLLPATFGALLFLHALAGCSAKTGTQVTLELMAEASVLDQAARLKVQIYTGDADLALEQEIMAPFAPLVARVPMRPRAEEEGRSFEIVAWLFDAEGGLLQKREARGAYVQGERRVVRQSFSAACEGTTCGIGETCIAGVCRPACFEPVPDDGTRGGEPLVPSPGCAVESVRAAVAFYACDEIGIGPIVDSSGHGHDISCDATCLLHTPSVSGTACEFMNNVALATAPIEALRGTELTLSVLTRPDPSRGTDVVMRYGDLELVVTDACATPFPTPAIRVAGPAESLTCASGSIAIQEWTHLAVTRDGSHLALFVDGVRVAATTTELQTATAALGIGGRVELPDDPGYLDGRLDLLGAHKIALVAEDIALLARQ